MFKNINSPDFGATTSNIDAIGENKTDLNASIRKVQHSQEDTTQSFFEFLPRELISEIVKKMPYPDLMLFKKAYEGINEYVFDSIGSRVIEKAKQRCNYKFEWLVSFIKNNEENCNLVTKAFKGKINVPFVGYINEVYVIHEGENEIKAETLQVKDIEWWDNPIFGLGCFFVGTLKNNCKFVFSRERIVNSYPKQSQPIIDKFDISNAYNVYYIYMAESYDDILILIKNKGEYYLKQDIDVLLKHDKIYY